MKNHLTPRYVLNRIAVFINSRVNSKDPWLTAKSVRLLRSQLNQSQIGVEFGSGRSTIWFAKRLKRLISFESDESWHKKISSVINQENLSEKVDYRFCKDEAEYTANIDAFEDASIDFCLVDGKHRSACANHIIPKLKNKGILVVDNVNWFLPNDKTHSPNSKRTSDGCASEDWKLFYDKVQDWKRIWTSNGVTDTCIFYKP